MEKAEAELPHWETVNGNSDHVIAKLASDYLVLEIDRDPSAPSHYRVRLNGVEFATTKRPNVELRSYKAFARYAVLNVLEKARENLGFTSEVE